MVSIPSDVTSCIFFSVYWINHTCSCLMWSSARVSGFIASGAVVIFSAPVIPGVSLSWWASSGSDRGVRHFRLCIVGKLWSHIDLFPKNPMMVCCGAAVDFTTRWGFIPSSLTRLSGGLPSSGHSLCTTALACQLPDSTPLTQSVIVVCCCVPTDCP